MPKMNKGIIAKSEPVHNEALDTVLLSLSHTITSKADLVQIIQHSLKSAVHFNDLVITRFDLQKGTFKFFFESWDLNSQDPFFNSFVLQEHPIADGMQDVVMNSEYSVTFNFKELAKEGMINTQFLEKKGIKSLAGIRLQQNGEIVGTILLLSKDEDAFSSEDLRVLEAVSHYFAKAMLNIIYLEEIQERSNGNEILLSTSEAFSHIRKKDDLLPILKQQLEKLSFYNDVAITKVDEDGKRFSGFLVNEDSTRVGDKDYRAIRNAHNVFPDGVFEVALYAESPVIYDLEAIMNSGHAPANIQFLYANGTRAMVGVPLKEKNKPIGVLFLFSDRVISFSPLQLRLAQGIGNQLASAVANIMAQEHIQLKEADKSFLIEFSRDIASARTKEDLSLAIHQSLKKLAQISVYFIRIINDDDLTLSSFMYKKDIHFKNDTGFKKLLNTKIKKTEGITGRVLSGNVPVFIDFQEETNQGNTDPYIEFWGKLGSEKAEIQKMIGLPLMVGTRKLGVLWVVTAEINLILLESISAQISVAISNILANEEISKKNEEQTFLLNFSYDITQVRTKPELQTVIFKVLDKILQTKLAMIHVIEDDGFNLSRFMYDSTLFEKAKVDFDELLAVPINIESPYMAQALASKDGLVYNVDDGLESSKVSERLWKSTGLKHMYSLPLRVGNKNLGIIWFLADKLSELMLKGICAQIAIAIANIQTNEKLLAYKKQLEGENDYLKEQIKSIYNSADIIGVSPQMQEIYRLMSLVSQSNSTVLLLGETGTGKELIARAIHSASPRKSKLMVKVNCAALPASLIESELFGHEKGSFTGAIERRIGKFELANNSTLFLDEIGEIPLEIQVKLLRVLQEREVERVGGKTTIKVDVRIIAATNRNLENEVKAGRFRSDLYYRLNVFPITLPPLRDRREDIAPLANFFLERYGKTSGKKVTSISPKCIGELESYDWPGNVRELEHLLERSILFAQGNVLTEIHLPKNPIQDSLDISYKKLQQLERGYIIDVLRRCNGKIAGEGGAAAVLGIPRTTLHSRMKKLGIRKTGY